jgi:hypothetical protein
MRYLTCCAAVLLLLAASLVVPSGHADASESADFVTWALEQGKSCDTNWDRFTSTVATGAVRKGSAGGEFTGGRAYRSYPRSSRKIGKSTTRSSISFKGRTSSTNFLSLSTRPRNGPTRGVGHLKSPAKARLTLGHKFKRPFNSRMQVKRSFSGRGVLFKRHKSTSFGRWSRSRRRGGFQRPAYRADRPKRR